MSEQPFSLKTVAVYPAEARSVFGPLLEALAALFPVRFTPYAGVMAEADGLLSLAADATVAMDAVEAGLPVLSMPKPREDALSCPERVRFVGRPLRQPYLQGIECRVEAQCGFQPILCEDGDERVAVADGVPIWTERRRGRTTFRQVATGAPELGPGQPVFPELLRGGWVRWLPLFHFLRELTNDIDWQPQALRACFMFDDPNLHWSSWGYINYAELAAQARQHRYHASMATVPLDMWFTHKPTAALFRQQAQYLSLLVHGVKHTHAELQSPQPATQRLGDLAWSLRRVQAMEARYGLRISRVMAPPHHVCSLAAADLMLQAGYEAACVGWLFLMRGNPQVSWRPDFGLQPAEFLGAGFPVVPRFNFAGQDPGRMALAAFFHQPIIMVGHHQDVAGGLDILADWAQSVNRMGEVRWVHLEEIMRSNYLTRRLNDTLFLKLGARRIQLKVPDGIREMVLIRPWLVPDRLEPISLIRDGIPQALPTTTAEFQPGITVNPGEVWEVDCPPPEWPPILAHTPALRLWPMFRRLACEARDRFLPVTDRLRRGRSARSLPIRQRS